MKKTSTLFFSLALFLSATLAQGQITYKDLNPDVVVNIDIGTFNSEKMDIDGDQSDDFNIISTNYPSFSIWNVGIQQIDTLNPKVEFLVDKSIAPSQIGDHYVKILSANDPIGPSADYSFDYPQIGDIYNNHFLGQGPRYMGFRIRSGSDYKYGWMAVELSGTADYVLTIRELAYNNTVNTAINASSGSLGIDDQDLPQLLVDVYPNPSADGLNIDCKEQCNLEEIKIYQTDGKLMYEANKPELPLAVPATEWESGHYIIHMRDSRGWSHSSWVKY